MIKNIFEDAVNGIETRKNLSRLRQEIKDDAKMDEVFELAEDHFEEMCEFLHSEDAKTRKNAALLMGELDMSDFMEPLMEAYEAEEQLFVKSAYLTALKNYDISEHLDFLKERLETLCAMELTEENKKHITEEIACLDELIIQEEGIKKHIFHSFSEPVECILLTNRFHKNITEEQIIDGEQIPFKGGVRVKTKNIAQFMKIRTYSELLFVIQGAKTCEPDPVKAAEMVAVSVLNMIKDSHGDTAPFYFRTEFKTKQELDKKSAFTRKFSKELEQLTKRELINSTSDYEFEFRLIENKEGNINILLKMNTLPDYRFTYRRESTATSIKPVNAALLVALAKEYMIEDAQVLDPFCGVGTMLIERQKQVKANTSYGIDISGEAIDKAKFNTDEAGQIIHYVNKDFFDFSHEYLFDEIFTDMPFAIGHKTKEDITGIYKNFFKHAKTVLKPEGIIIMYTRNKELVYQLAAKNGYRVEKSWEIGKKEETWLLVIQSSQKVKYS